MRRQKGEDNDRPRQFGAATVLPQAAPALRIGLNLVVLARPYFGLIVLATLLLAVFGFLSMLRMPSGIYPEVAFPRITIVAQTPGLAVTTVEVAVTRPIEEAVEHGAGRSHGALEDASAGRRRWTSISRPAPTWCRP